MLTGSLPFQGKDRKETMNLILKWGFVEFLVISLTLHLIAICWTEKSILISKQLKYYSLVVTLPTGLWWFFDFCCLIMVGFVFQGKVGYATVSECWSAKLTKSSLQEEPHQQTWYTILSLLNVILYYLLKFLCCWHGDETVLIYSDVLWSWLLTRIWARWSRRDQTAFILHDHWLECKNLSADLKEYLKSHPPLLRSEWSLFWLFLETLQAWDKTSIQASCSQTRWHLLLRFRVHISYP